MVCHAADRICGRLEHSHDHGQGASPLVLAIRRQLRQLPMGLVHTVGLALWLALVIWYSCFYEQFDRMLPPNRGAIGVATVPVEAGMLNATGSLCLLFAVLPLRQHLPWLRQRKGCEFYLPGFRYRNRVRRGDRGTVIALRSTRSVPPAAEPLGRVRLLLQASASPARMARTSSAAAARSARHAHQAAASARERTLSSPSEGIGKRSDAGPDESCGTLRLISGAHARFRAW
jgi:hypothetical protein